MGRLGIRIANGVLFALCCFLAATVVNNISAELLTPPSAVVRPGPERAVAQVASWRDREVIIERNLFGSKTSPEAVEVIDDTPDEEPVEETQLPLILLGTVAADDKNHLAPESARAAVQDKTTREHQVVAIGDQLTAYPQVTVKDISRKSVLLDNRGRLEELKLADEDGPQLASASKAPRERRNRNGRSRARKPRPSSRLGDRIAKLREDQKEGGRSAANLFQQAKMQPKYEDGQMIGMQFDDIKPGSLWEKVGLNDGDIVTEVNGIEVNTAAASAQILSQFTEAAEFKIVVRGPNGETREKEVAANEVEALLR